MRFVYNQHIDFFDELVLDMRSCFECGDSNATGLYPRFECLGSACSVNFCDAKFAVSDNLATPVGNDACWANNYKM